MLLCETTARTNLASNETTLMIAKRCRDQAEAKVKKLEIALERHGNRYGAGDYWDTRAVEKRKDRIEHFDSLAYAWDIIVDDITYELELGKPG